MELSIKNLVSGGLITNYYCTSGCKHCLYKSGPKWKKEFIDESAAKENLRKIKELGCNSLHIGGGEPFLNLEGLKNVLITFKNCSVHVQYVETNSSWYKNHEQACSVLNSLKKYGLNSLLISMSPFHNEHIPFYKVKGLIEACRSTGISVFPWVRDFFHEINGFDDKLCHSMCEYEEKYGPGYLESIPGRYWVEYRGRALNTFRPFFNKQSLESILKDNNLKCDELLDVSHFHMDLFGNYIPGLCSGLSIYRDDLGREIDASGYPVLTALLTSGIRGLFDLAVSSYGFKPEKFYISKCDLCYSIRKYLVTEIKQNFKDLMPEDFYILE